MVFRFACSYKHVFFDFHVSFQIFCTAIVLIIFLLVFHFNYRKQFPNSTVFDFTVIRLQFSVQKVRAGMAVTFSCVCLVLIHLSDI
jgi:hypothetical protein